jgi:hypothetical protein
VLGRIRDVQSGAEDRDGVAAGLQRRAVGDAVDPGRAPGDDGDPGAREAPAISRASASP